MPGTTGPRRAPSHQLRQNEGEWSPPALITFDTEAWRETLPRGERQTLRLWAARLDVRRHPGARAGEVQLADGTTGAQLAAAIDGWTTGLQTVWCYAHNLSYDLQLSDVIGQLGELGWHAGRHALASTSPWIVLARGRKRLTFCDSLSWLRKPLADIAAGIGSAKLPLPGNDDPDDLMLERCRGDVADLAAALRQLLRWWDTQHCGWWSYTGSTTAWNHWRHKWTDSSIHIGLDDDGCQRDREAVYGGARGISRHGMQRGGPYAELDFESAYAHTAASWPLPHGRLARFGSAVLDDDAIDGADRGMIAWCRLATTEPRWPVRANGGVAYPTGEFWTVLASPEIAEARQLGALLEIGAGRYHRLGTQFRDWACWSLEANRSNGHGASYPVALFAKGAGRAVIGKTGQHGWQVTAEWEQPGTDWHMEHGIRADTGQRITRTVIGGRGREVTETGDGDNAYPAILAFVESRCRVALMRAIAAAGPADVMQWDTDGLLAPDRGPAQLAAINAATRPLRMRAKKSIEWADLRGPQMLFTSHGNKTSGIPAKTRWEADGTGKGETWPTLPGQMSRGKAGEVMIETVEFADPGYSVMAWICDDGAVIPPEYRVDQDGRNQLLPFDQTAAYAAGRRLADRQSAGWLLTAHVLGAWPDCVPECLSRSCRRGQVTRPAERARQLLSVAAEQPVKPSRPVLMPRQWAPAASVAPAAGGVRRQRRRLSRARRRRS